MAVTGPVRADYLLSGMPQYFWWGGCSPTSGGMVIGYWDQLPGFGNLYYGDASVWEGNTYPGTYGTAAMISSEEHVAAGDGKGYNTSIGCGSPDDHPANCIADFMGTENGGSYTRGIVDGMIAYTQWDNPDTPVNESYPSECWYEEVGYWGGDFIFADFVAEIDAGRPMLLDVRTYQPPPNPGQVWVGHTVVAYGYADGADPYFAVRDTWESPGQDPPGSYIDDNDVEWWPWVEFDGASSKLDWDWEIDEGVYYLATPEPFSTLLVTLAGAFCLLVRRRLSGKEKRS